MAEGWLFKHYSLPLLNVFSICAPKIFIEYHFRDCQEELSVGTSPFAKILIARKQKSKNESKEA